MKKLVKILLWISLFPFMLTYWGWKNKKCPIMAIGALLSLLFVVIGLFNQETSKESLTGSSNLVTVQSVDQNSSSKSGIFSQSSQETETDNTASSQDIVVSSNQESSDTNLKANDKGNDSLFEGFTLINVDGGDVSGHREPKVVVDVGFGDREYWAFTNEYGQLIKVIADEIILQDDKSEQTTSEGRYYPDEANVPGTEDPNLDEGHVIADSLGGVSNAYNITPQNSTLNRSGNQAYMEKVIRDAGGCTNFTAIITYPDSSSQIPSHYSFTYTLLENVINDEFDNVNPDEVNDNTSDNLINATSSAIRVNSNSDNIIISDLDKKAELIVIKNIGGSTVNLSGWKIRSVTGNQYFTFPDFTLSPDTSVKIGDSDTNEDIVFQWFEGRGIWNNSDSDPAELYNNTGDFIYRLED